MTTQHSFTNTPYATLRTLYVCEQALISSTVTWINKVRTVMPKEEIKAAWLRVNELHKTSQQVHAEMCGREDLAMIRLKVLQELQDACIDKILDGAVTCTKWELTEDEFNELQDCSKKLKEVNQKMRELIEEYSLGSLCYAEVSAEHGEMFTV